MSQLKRFDLNALFTSLDNQLVSKFVFCTADQLKSQVMQLKPGSMIPPCKMENDVIFVFMKGEGKVIVDDKIIRVCAGDV